MTRTKPSAVAFIVLCAIPWTVSIAQDSPEFRGEAICEGKLWNPQDWPDDRIRQIRQYEHCVDSYLDAPVVALDGQVNGTTLRTGDGRLRVAADLLANAKEAEQEAEDEKEFLGFRWGLGVGVALGSNTRVSSADVIDGAVRITNETTDEPRIVLEIHDFWWRFHGENRRLFKGRTSGLGPFAAVNFGATDGETLASFGGGVMFGVKRLEGKGSFNIGIGLMIDKDVKMLGDGIVNGEPLPGNETEIRFRTKSDRSLLIFVSTSF